MNKLDEKLNKYFSGKVVRKDLTKLVKGNAVVPTYVLEYLLGQYCATDDEESIIAGVETVKSIIAKHYVNRDEAELIKSTIREKSGHKVIDKLQVFFNDKDDRYEATFSNLGLKKVPIHSSMVKQHLKLLTGGVWSLVDLNYMAVDSPKDSPWIIEKLKPIQLSSFDNEEFKELRNHFETEEWIDLLMQTIGLNPQHFSKRQKILQLTRLIPFCERNYNLIELGPKGTGKSYVYSEFSPHCMLLSGGEVTVAKLFVNNSSGNIGLVGYWDTVAFDEFAGKAKKTNRSLVDIMKNYMANQSFSRGRESLQAEASMAFVGNTDKSVPYMLKHTDLFEALPKGYYDTAFLDRLHCYLPGWEVDIIRNEMFTDGYGFIVDYYAECLRDLRKFDYSDFIDDYFELDSSIATRDKLGIKKTVSGLTKIIYPHKEASKDEIEYILKYAVEGRKRVKDQLLKMDETYEPVKFRFVDKESDQEELVETRENIDFANILIPQANDLEKVTEETKSSLKNSTSNRPVLRSGVHKVVKEDELGVSYEDLFSDYLKDAKEIHLTDAYLREKYQIINLHDFCRLILKLVPEGEEVTLKVFTKENVSSPREQSETFEILKNTYVNTALNLFIEVDGDASFHDRSIETDHGWKIILGRGLDMFQPYDFKNPFNLANAEQKERRCKDFEVTYIKTGE